MYSQRLYKANEDNKNGFFGFHKGEISDFLNENPNSFHGATLHKKLKELGYSREL